VDNPSNSPITYCNSMTYCSKCETLLCEKCWDRCLRCECSLCTTCMGDDPEDRCDCCEKICGDCKFRCRFCGDAVCVDCGGECACGKTMCTSEECSSIIEGDGDGVVCRECKCRCSKCGNDRREDSLVLCVGCWKYVCEDATDCWNDSTKRCNSCVP